VLLEGPAAAPPGLGFGKVRSSPARREMRSARSASRVLLEGEW